MNTNFLINKIIAEKKTARHLAFLQGGIFFLAALYVLLYEMVLVDIPAANHELYVLGKIVNGVAQATVTGYIFYFFTEIETERSKKRSIKPIVEYQKVQLADQLDSLMKILLKDSEWKEKDDDVLKRNYEEIAKTRQIWIEHCSGLFKDDMGVMYIQPTTLFCVDRLMQRITDSIDKFISMSRYIDQNYFEEICWLSESKLIQRLHICDGEYKLADSVTKNGDTYLDDFFNKDLFSILFSVDKANRTFVKKVRELIEQTVGAKNHEK